jgi:hypothetical protein
MTLIVAHVARYGVIHVSDRLLTERGTARPLDAFSNKALLYLCADAIVAIGYTGLAYIGDSPADVWIANLSNRRVTKKPRFLMRGDTSPPCTCRPICFS